MRIMPLYHFNVNAEIDAEGIELSDIAVAKCEAVKLAGQLICEEHADTFWDAGEWTMNVTNGSGLALFQLILFGTEAPVTQKPRPWAPEHVRTEKG